MKRCSRCRNMKSLSEFQRNRSTPSGYSYRCKSCIHKVDHPRTARWRQTPKGEQGVRRFNSQRVARETAERAQRRKAQKYRCAICNRHERTVGTLVSDHCHNNGHLREMLCQGCNLGLGHFQDDSVRLLAAVEYLSRHAVRVG